MSGPIFPHIISLLKKLTGPPATLTKTADLGLIWPASLLRTSTWPPGLALAFEDWDLMLLATVYGKALRMCIYIYIYIQYIEIRRCIDIHYTYCAYYTYKVVALQMVKAAKR